MSEFNGRAIAKFEKVSYGQFLADAGSEGNYEAVELPVRSTRGSAGYDFVSPMSILLEPGESVVVSTGIRCKIKEGYMLGIYPRSGLGFKYSVCLANTVGIIDSDYYGAENEGHIRVKLVNRGDKRLVIEEGMKFCQGIFSEYFLTVDDAADGERTGGFGSTGK